MPTKQVTDLDPRTPVIVGAGQIVQRPGEQDQPRSPIELAVEALRRAGEDSGTGDKLLKRADSARHVASVSWSYTDEGALIAGELGANPRETVRTSTFGGDGPQRMVGDTAQAIADGEIDVALVSGGEAFASMRAAQRSGTELPWLEQRDGSTPTRVLGSDRQAVSEPEIAVGLIVPATVYALLETAVRARAGRTPEQHAAAIAKLWAGFSEVAAGNPYAWLPEARSAAEIGTPGPRNRWVSAPYLKLLTANIDVDQASGLILCSARAALDAGVPRERWVFPWAGAHAQDEWFVTERDELAASPAIRACGGAVLDHAGVSIDDVEHVDLYSCFPSAVQIAARELGLSTARPLTVTGGLTFAGGPANNYAGHSIATMVGRLRSDREALGLTTALGWYVTKHAIGLYSAKQPTTLYRDIEPAVQRRPARQATADYSGPAAVEAYTVHYGGEGPEALIMTALTPGGTRALARTSDTAIIKAALDHDLVGAPVSLAVAGPVTLEALEVTRSLA